jgi:hypothetical protein
VGSFTRLSGILQNGEHNGYFKKIMDLYRFLLIFWGDFKGDFFTDDAAKYG